MAEQSKPRRRWLRFSLRGLLVFMAIASAVIGMRLKKVRDEDKAVAELRRAGFTVSSHQPSATPHPLFGGHLEPPIRELPPYWKRILFGNGEREWRIVARVDPFDSIARSFRPPLSGDGTLMPAIDDTTVSNLIDDLRSIGKISLLGLQGTSIGNETLRGLSSLRRLRSLDIRGTGVDDSGLAHLESMKWLEELRLGEVIRGRADRTTNEGLNHLEQALPSTRVLSEGMPTSGGFTIPILSFNGKTAGRFLRHGDALLEEGNYDGAVADFEEAVRLEPRNAPAHDRLARLLATCPDQELRDGKRAVSFSTRACELAQWNNAAFLDTLAAACAETGEFMSAVKWIDKALSIKPGDAVLKAHRELFKARKPIRVSLPTPEPERDREA